MLAKKCFLNPIEIKTLSERSPFYTATWANNTETLIFLKTSLDEKCNIVTSETGAFTPEEYRKELITERCHTEASFDDLMAYWDFLQGYRSENKFDYNAILYKVKDEDLQEYEQYLYIGLQCAQSVVSAPALAYRTRLQHNANFIEYMQGRRGTGKVPGLPRDYAKNNLKAATFLYDILKKNEKHLRWTVHGMAKLTFNQLMGWFRKQRLIVESKASRDDEIAYARNLLFCTHVLLYYVFLKAVQKKKYVPISARNLRIPYHLWPISPHGALELQEKFQDQMLHGLALAEDIKSGGYHTYAEKMNVIGWIKINNTYASEGLLNKSFSENFVASVNAGKQLAASANNKGTWFVHNYTRTSIYMRDVDLKSMPSTALFDESINNAISFGSLELQYPSWAKIVKEAETIHSDYAKPWLEYFLRNSNAQSANEIEVLLIRCSYCIRRVICCIDELIAIAENNYLIEHDEDCDYYDKLTRDRYPRVGLNIYKHTDKEGYEVSTAYDGKLVQKIVERVTRESIDNNENESYQHKEIVQSIVDKNGLIEKIVRFMITMRKTEVTGNRCYYAVDSLATAARLRVSSMTFDDLEKAQQYVSPYTHIHIPGNVYTQSKGKILSEVCIIPAVCLKDGLSTVVVGAYTKRAEL